MPQSLSKVYLHIVFSTKNRIKLIDSNIENRLYAYIAGICNEIGCHALRVGGYLDHVHILCRMRRDLTISKLLQEIKSNSSRWMKMQGEVYQDFYWQNGYGVFSIGESRTEQVKNYIARQKKHHAKQSFQSEYLSLLEAYKVEFSEQFLWD